MGGIFGVISNGVLDIKKLRVLAMHSRQRGKGSSGLAYHDAENGYKIVRADCDLAQLLNKVKWSNSSIVMGYSGLMGNRLPESKPGVSDRVFVFYDGLIVNEKDALRNIGAEQQFKDGSDIIIKIALQHLAEGSDLKELPNRVMSIWEGTIAAALVIPDLGKAILFSNSRNLYVGTIDTNIYFASECYPLKVIASSNIIQAGREGVIIDIPVTSKIEVIDLQQRQLNNQSFPFRNLATEEKMLQYHQPNLRRCTKCILPETMPFIEFDSDGVCNYCHSYKPRNATKSFEELLSVVKPYRRKNEPDCIVPLSGGRDSCYCLHVIVKELQMTPITYTYDWGMITDLGYRNISRICSKLGVENIVVAADIERKRANITANLKAWLKDPHLGMVSILTAGDKQFFRYIESIKKQTGINLSLWGVNPLEVTHFKAGFLGIRPRFNDKKVYMSGLSSQLEYQYRRFIIMLRNPSYFNISLWDTLSGEYYRSIYKKRDYFHIYDYWRWDEKIVEETLRKYDWELAPDTKTTWRIGDGTAAFYNYIYYTVAGFTEHDTFRSNQIREGQLTRDEALEIVRVENQPRYQNIKWYLDILGMDFTEVIKVVNAIPKLY